MKENDAVLEMTSISGSQIRLATCYVGVEKVQKTTESCELCAWYSIIDNTILPPKEILKHIHQQSTKNIHCYRMQHNIKYLSIEEGLKITERFCVGFGNVVVQVIGTCVVGFLSDFRFVKLLLNSCFVRNIEVITMFRVVKWLKLQILTSDIYLRFQENFMGSVWGE